MNQRGFSPILVILAIAIVGILALAGLYSFYTRESDNLLFGDQITLAKKFSSLYGSKQTGVTPILSPTPVSIKNWENYTYPSKLFTLKYPPNLYATDGVGQVFLVKKEAHPAERIDWSDHVVDIRVDTSTYRFDAYYKTPNNTKVDGYGDLKLRNYLIDGYKAVEYGYDEVSKEEEIEEQRKDLESGTSVGMIYFPKGVIINKDGTIIEIFTKSYYQDFKKPFDQILSTVKFLDQPQSSQDSDMRENPRPVCDLNLDFSVDGNDIAIFSTTFGKCLGDSSYNPEADLFSDGCVDEQDRQICLLQLTPPPNRR